MTETDSRQLVLRGVEVSQDEDNRICLDDLWRLSGGSPGRTPKQWRRTGPATALERALQEKVGNPHLFGSVISAKRGRGAKGTFAHPIIAAAYAGYLDPGLEVEIRDVWLRYRSGDPTLADDILQRASAEANHWAGVRALSRSRRRSYTDVLKAHGVAQKGYMECTEAVYLHLLGGKSYQIRAAMKLKPKANLREHLEADNLAYIMAAEALSAERIQEEERRGNAACAQASAISAQAIRRAIEDDRRNRQHRLVG